MSQIVLPNQMSIEWGLAARPIDGQTVSGDLHLIKAIKAGLFIAVVDGLGHGLEAQAAAQAAVAILDQYADETVTKVVQRCHDGLTNTRGAVMTVATVNTTDQTLTWLGVGNVEGRLFRAVPRSSALSESVLLRGGLVGCRIPELQSNVIPFSAGDMLAFATDGINSSFDIGLNWKQSPEIIAKDIMTRHFKGTVGSSRVDLQACKLEYSIVSPK